MNPAIEPHGSGGEPTWCNAPTSSRGRRLRVPDPLVLCADLAIEQPDLVVIVLGIVGVAGRDEFSKLGPVLVQASWIGCRRHGFDSPEL